MNMTHGNTNKRFFVWAVLIIFAIFVLGGVFSYPRPLWANEEATQKLLSVVDSASVEEVTRLIQEGADVNAVTDDGQTSGVTPLMFAARNNSNLEVLQVLIENGADVNAADSDSKRALDYAEENEALRGSDALILLREKTLSVTK